MLWDWAIDAEFLNIVYFHVDVLLYVHGRAYCSGATSPNSPPNQINKRSIQSFMCIHVIKYINTAGHQTAGWRLSCGFRSNSCGFPGGQLGKPTGDFTIISISSDGRDLTARSANTPARCPCGPYLRLARSVLAPCSLPIPPLWFDILTPPPPPSARFPIPIGLGFRPRSLFR